MGENLAAIDIGTNSIHLVVARFDEAGHFEVIGDEKETVRLGSGGGDMKQLSPDAIDRGIAALTRLRQVADISAAEVTAVATSAVREAENADDFLRRARHEAGVEVEVISGTEEARLIHLGVLQAVPVYDRRLILIDIGGGSTEVLVGERSEILAVRSFKLGAIRLTRRFFRTDRVHPGAVDACRRFIDAMLAPLAREVARLGFEVAVGSSGTIEAVAAMVHADQGDAPPRTVDNATITAAEARSTVKRLAALSLAKRREVAGLEASRADIVLAGAIILEQAMATFGIDELVVSGYALREGALLDAFQRTHGGRPAPPPRPAAAQRGPPGRDDGRGAGPLGPRGPPGPGAVRRHRRPPRPGRRCPRTARGGRPAGQRGPVRLPQQAPQAHLLRHPQQRPPVGVQRPRDRDDRPGGPLPPQERALGQAPRVRRPAPPRPGDGAHTGRHPAGGHRAGPHPRRPACRASAPTSIVGPLVVEVEAAPDADISLELYTANERRELLEAVLDRRVSVVPAPQVSPLDAAEPAPVR